MPPCAVIAGASSGIGHATALHLLAAGWDVAVLARRPAPLDALARRAPGRVLALPADLTDEALVMGAARAIAAWRPALQALVTAAGDFLVRPIRETTTAEFERLWRVNVLSKFLLVRELLPALTPPGDAPPSAIVHVASLAVHQDFADESAYGSSMHAVVGMGRSQDVEFKARRVRVSVISPGLVRTELTERSNFPPALLAQALPADAMARSIATLIETTRAGGYIPELLHVPGNL